MNGKNWERKPQFHTDSHFGKGDFFSFAGIWDEYETVDGENQHTFLILTTEPNELVSEVHDRMPVVLTQETEKKMAQQLQRRRRTTGNTQAIFS